MSWASVSASCVCGSLSRRTQDYNDCLVLTADDDDDDGDDDNDDDDDDELIRSSLLCRGKYNELLRRERNTRTSSSVEQFLHVFSDALPSNDDADVDDQDG